MFIFKNIYFQAFSVFFICIALTSDMICFLFIPVHWLFFAASTYVWVQYVWHTGPAPEFEKIYFYDLLIFREGNLPTNSIPLATLRLYRGRCEAEGIQTPL